MDNRLRYLPYGIAAFGIVLFAVLVPYTYGSFVRASRHAVCPPVAIHTMAPCLQCQKEFDAPLPRGTRIYAFDEYIVKEAGRVTNVPAGVTFTWDHCGTTMTAVDSATGYRRTFSHDANVTENLDFVETALRPGEAVPADLRQALKRHQARLDRTI